MLALIKRCSGQSLFHLFSFLAFSVVSSSFASFSICSLNKSTIAYLRARSCFYSINKITQSVIRALEDYCCSAIVIVQLLLVGQVGLSGCGWGWRRRLLCFTLLCSALFCSAPLPGNSFEAICPATVCHCLSVYKTLALWGSAIVRRNTCNLCNNASICLAFSRIVAIGPYAYLNNSQRQPKPQFQCVARPHSNRKQHFY